MVIAGRPGMKGGIMNTGSGIWVGALANTDCMKIRIGMGDPSKMF